MTVVSVLVPLSLDLDPAREAAWLWVLDRYREWHPQWEIITGCGDTDRGFSRTQGILDAFAHCDGDMLVVADGDCWCDPSEAVSAAAWSGWAIPHLLVHRLSEASTQAVLSGHPSWHGLPLSTDNRQDSQPYRGHECGTLVVMQRAVFEDVPPDPRFVGWGQEDDAWAAALHMLVGKPWRGGDDLMHLWHPPQIRPKLTGVLAGRERDIGSKENLALLRRYRKADSPRAMRRLLAEFRSQLALGG